MSGDIDRDERLRAALRHAPDAALAAPPDISAQILAAAHRAAAERAPAPPPPKRPWWVFQTPRRLGASGAFATVLLAGVLGLLWRGQQPGPETEVLREAAAPVAAPAPAAAPAPEPAAKPVEAPAPIVAAAPRLQQPQQQAAQARARPDASQRQAPFDSRREVARNEERRTAELKERDSPRLAKEEAAWPVPPPPAPAAAPAPAAGAMSDASPPVLARRSAPAVTGALMARPRPSGPWIDALAAGADVQWKVDGEARAPSSSWLYALAEQTQGRWRPAPSAAPPAGDSTVQWQRGDTLLGRLWLGDERALWCDAQSRCEEALLDAGVGPVLRKGLAR